MLFMPLQDSLQEIMYHGPVGAECHCGAAIMLTLRVRIRVGENEFSRRNCMSVQGKIIRA